MVAAVVACVWGFIPPGGAAAPIAAPPASPTPAEIQAKKTFNQRCTACHTFGRGVKVGPDLKSVTQRRPRAWLLQFIRSSQRMIQSGDAIAAGLFQEFKRQRMPDWTDLSEAEVGAILDWLAVDGPEHKAIDERHADAATTADVDLGRALFHGRRSFANGSMACASCHGIRDGASSHFGSLGPDLTTSYLDYQDRALTRFFRRPCFARVPDSSGEGFLVPEEAFALKAYLRQAALSEAGTGAPPTPSPSAAGRGKRGSP
jgi:mono/diheme cytochrome c family protein